MINVPYCKEIRLQIPAWEISRYLGVVLEEGGVWGKEDAVPLNLSFKAAIFFVVWESIVTPGERQALPRGWSS